MIEITVLAVFAISVLAYMTYQLMESLKQVTALVKAKDLKEYKETVLPQEEVQPEPESPHVSISDVRPEQLFKRD